MKDVTLVLEDGTRFKGRSFGYDADVCGEVVFNTAMTGYPESLTDPSYAGQIMVLTYPLVGNYGVPPFSIGENGLATFMESDKIHVRAMIVSDYSEDYSHWNACESLSQWLKREKVPGVTGIDTRALTKILREKGVMMGEIRMENPAAQSQEAEESVGLSDTNCASVVGENYGTINWIERVSCREVVHYVPEQSSAVAAEGVGEGGRVASCSPDEELQSSIHKRVVLVDCGVKNNIIRCLLRRGVEVIRVPWDYDFNQLDDAAASSVGQACGCSSMGFDALFLANGPGDPDMAEATVANIRRFMEREQSRISALPCGQGGVEAARPIMGICMGNQLLAKAAGATVYKLKYGHRSHNQPVRQVGTNRCFITSQNHGYAVDTTTLAADWEPLFVNMNDGSNEGIRHKSMPWFSAQFHPEAASGPTDTEFLFDNFVKAIEK